MRTITTNSLQTKQPIRQQLAEVSNIFSNNSKYAPKPKPKKDNSLSYNQFDYDSHYQNINK